MNESTASPSIDLNTFRVINVVFQFLICGCIMPMQIVCIFTLLRIREFHRNASLQIVVRLIVLDFLQTSALLVTGFYHVYPRLAEFEPLRKTCSVILIALFLGKVPLQLELTICRILIVTKMSSHQKLPLVLKVSEVLTWAGVVIVSVAAWITDAFIYHDGIWFYNDKHWIPQLLASAELYFCLPLCSVTYILYTLLIIMIFAKGSRFSKEEWPLFLQCTTMFLTETIGIIVYHIPDILGMPEIFESPWYALFNTYNWTIAFAWTSLFLLICNRTVRSKIWWKSSTTVTTTTSLTRSAASY